MMHRLVFFLLLTVCVISAVSTPTLALIGAWTDYGTRFGASAGIMCLVTVVSGFGAGLAHDDLPAREKRLPRKYRKELRDAEARIQLERQIKELEEVNGVARDEV